MFMSVLPSAMAHLDVICSIAVTKRLVVFVDYDGTLTPIAAQPEEAVLSEAMRRVLSDLATVWQVAVVSGRGLEDVRANVRLDTLYYAGSHGFEMAGPNGLSKIYQPAEAFLETLDQAETVLVERLRQVDGLRIERKQFAIAIHYRHANEHDIPEVVASVDAVRQELPTLRQTGGKKVFELRPNLDWHKGTALFWLIEAMGLTSQEVWPIYIGDDVTDEDAFDVLDQHGMGILVAPSHRATAAHYRLGSTAEVQDFLTALSAYPPPRS